MGIFFKRSRAANSEVHGRILPNFELVRDIMVVLHTCKNKEDLVKNEGATVLTRLYVVFSDSQGHSEVSGEILQKFEFIQTLKVVLLTCKNEEDPIKNEGARVLTTFLPLSTGIFSDAQGQLSPQSLVESGRNSNSSEILWLSSLHASMIKALEC